MSVGIALPRVIRKYPLSILLNPSYDVSCFHSPKSFGTHSLSFYAKPTVNRIVTFTKETHREKVEGKGIKLLRL